MAATLGRIAAVQDTHTKRLDKIDGRLERMDSRMDRLEIKVDGLIRDLPTMLTEAVRDGLKGRTD